MADQVKVEIVTVDAVSNLEELRKKIKEAKDNLATLNLGSKEYRDQLKQVIEGQNLLRAAMNGTTATAEHLKDAIDKEGTSYNSLVNQMANLKREFRAATTEAERADLGGRIKEINDQLKAMDAMKGDFQRNVGDYFNQTSKAMKEVIKDLPSGLNAIKGPMDDVEKSMSLMSKQPILGIIGLLAPLLTQIAGALKEDDAAMGAVKKAMDALKPLMDFFSGVLANIVDILGDLIGRVTEFVQSNGIVQKVINAVAGIGNAIVNFIAAPVKGVIAAIKVFKEQGVKGLADAGKAFAAEMKGGVAFKSNYEAGQAMADGILSGARSRKKESRETGKVIAQEVTKGAEETFDEWMAKLFDRAEKAAAERLRKRKEDESFVDALIAENLAEINAEMEAYFEAERVMEETSVKMAQDAAKKKMAAMSAYASGVSGLLGSVADALESGDEASEASVKAAKNLRIASATIDMISGAVTAYSTAQSLGPIAGPIVGAINAAAVVASGLANIAKIRSTNVSKDSAPTESVDATVSAPQTPTVAPTTVTTGATTERALNAASQPQKVYVLQSDIEAAGDASKVQVAESTF